MIKIYLFLFFILISTIFSKTDEECQAKSNTSCQECLDVGHCAYCDDSKTCFDSSTTSLETNAQTLAIILGCVGGVILITIIIVIVCICRRCKQRKLNKERRQEALAEQNREDRRAAAEIRSADRVRAADQLRMKYGILREKENASDYKRFS